MTKKIIYLFILFALKSFAQTEHIVISEIATRSQANSSDEFVELYNPTDATVDISNWKIEYKSASGTTWSTRANIPQGKSIPPKSFFLIVSPNYIGQVIPDYHPMEWSAGIANDGGHLRLYNTLTSSVIDKVGYGTAIDPEGCPAPAHGTSVNNNSIERKYNFNSTSDSLCDSGPHSLMGNGFDSEQNCNDFVIRTCGRNPQNSSSNPEPVLCNGSGIATVFPNTLNGNLDTLIVINFKRDLNQTISDLRIVIPSEFDWNQNSNSITATNIVANLSVTNDTILFANVSFTLDSSEITINNITTPSSTGIYNFYVQTKCESFANVNPIPSMNVIGTAVSISQIKEIDSNGVPLMTSQLATIQGIVTVASQFGGPSYIQDNTGGVALYGSNFSNSVTIGDEVLVTGTVELYNGLTELTNLTLHSIVSNGNSVEPILINTQQLNESVEGLLVKIENVVVRDTFGNPIAIFDCGTTGKNYRLYDNFGYIETRVDNNTDLCGTVAPQDEFDIIGVVGQYDNSLPYLSGYQILPRSLNDVASCGPTITSVPNETNLSQTSLTINWTTKKNSSSFVKVGTTENYELGIFGNSTPTTNHSVNITGLSPATIYFAKAFSDSLNDTCYANNIFVSTTSQSQSSGTINAYFNKSIFSGVSSGTIANGNTNLIQKILNRINSSHHSIDATLYSLSGGNEGEIIATALVAAKNNRGVKVRVICEADNSQSNAFAILQQNGITLITDQYGNNTGSGYMHNKFFVFDGRGGSPESVWVWTGSWNPSQQGTQSDNQNAIEIQDVSMANTFTKEFEEMWGSNSDVPNAILSRFGARKLNNTPHKFLVNNNQVEIYFSPSDKTSSRLKKLISETQNDMAFSLFGFTQYQLADSIIKIKLNGKKVRGAMDSNTDLGNVYQQLINNGIDVKLKTSGGTLHHKYAIFDVLGNNLSSHVWTGSMNWTNSGEGSNDENIVLIQNNSIANQYLQEFAQRYYDYGGSDTIVLSVLENSFPTKFLLQQNFPNPFNPKTKIKYEIVKSGFVNLKVFDILGREIKTLVNENQNVGYYETDFDANNLNSGIYFYKLTTNNFSEMKKMILIK